ncbi:MAG: hypothetical protein AB1592_13335 [Pseudomonadota bacterium]
MGVQIEAGEHEINFTDGSWLVVRWCIRAANAAGITHRPPEDENDPDTLFTIYLSPACVEEAEHLVPKDFLLAKAEGWLEGHYRRPIDEHAFAQCREFLSRAASSNSAITGG